MELIKTLTQARERALALLQTSTAQTLEQLQIIISLYPDDAILQFLYASELAQQEQYIEALSAFEKSVTLDKSFYIARFQLCLLAATLDHPKLVEQHLPSLMSLNTEHYLHHFAHAIFFILQQEEHQAITHIQQGIKLNHENLALNIDMQNLIQTLAVEVNNDNEMISDEVVKSEIVNKKTVTEDKQNDIANSMLLDIYKKRK